jgi:hypothetical protein
VIGVKCHNNPIAGDLTTTAVNQILALLVRADTLLHSISSSPNLNTQPLLAFFSQLNRAIQGVLAAREGLLVGKAKDPTALQGSTEHLLVGKAKDPTALQGSTELKGLAKQVQAINSKLGAIQAQLQKLTKLYKAAVATTHTQPQGPLPKAPVNHTHMLDWCWYLRYHLMLPSMKNSLVTCSIGSTLHFPPVLQDSYKSLIKILKNCTNNTVPNNNVCICLYMFVITLWTSFCIIFEYISKVAFVTRV